MALTVTPRFMTGNDCYRAGKKIAVQGIMVHSTCVPGVMAPAWFSLWNKSYSKGEMDRQVCVHAFLDDKGACQYLPWDHRGWHCGGSANNTHIGVEICEPGGFSYGAGSTMLGYDAAANEPYFTAVWHNAVAFCVHLCREFGLTEKDIICHSEGAALGVASNHGDVMHWFPKHGKDMDAFRQAVKETLAAQ
jgi:N-acetylmuramoyl-L-alanine amidase CwlA